MNGRRNWTLGAVLLGTLAALLLLGPGPGKSSPPAQAEDTLDAALRAYVEGLGETYAGSCDAASLNEHAGMWCSQVKARTGSRALVDFGPTFSEFVESVVFERVDGAWRPAEERRAHVVQPGDTLFRIANRFDVSVEAIVQRNEIEDPNVLTAGSILIIRASGEEPEAQVPPCLQERTGFVSAGPIASLGEGPGDARQVLDFRLGIYETCERVVIDLADAEGSAATTSAPIEAAFLEGRPVVRISLEDGPDLEDLTGTETDRDLDGELARSAYLVRTLDGGVFIDVHLASNDIAARVTLLEDPARIVVDLKPVASTMAATADNVVVLDPLPETVQQYPLTITGYARTFEANVIAIVRAPGQEEAMNFTTAASWAETWGEFELTIEEGPTGEVELFVGEESARDGSEQGVRYKIRIEAQ